MVKQEGTNFIAQNLRWLMQREQLNQYTLAEAAGLSQPTINRILAGTRMRPRVATLHALARYFDVTLEDLRFKNFSDRSALPQTLRGIKIPMVNSSIAGLQKIDPAQWQDRITTYSEVSADAFGMNISDDGMKPRINIGDIVIVEPRRIPQPGNLVAARLADHGSAFVRIYKAVESATNAKREFELLAENQLHPKHSSRAEKISVLGVCIERVEKLV